MVKDVAAARRREPADTDPIGWAMDRGAGRRSPGRPRRQRAGRPTGATSASRMQPRARGRRSCRRPRSDRVRRHALRLGRRTTMSAAPATWMSRIAAAGQGSRRSASSAARRRSRTARQVRAAADERGPISAMATPTPRSARIRRSSGAGPASTSGSRSSGRPRPGRTARPRPTPAGPWPTRRPGEQSTDREHAEAYP